MTVLEHEVEVVQAHWADLLPDEEWNEHKRIIDLAQERGLRFALGGGLAFSTYSGRWRNTKDLDLFVLPQEREAMIQVAADAGFTDYYQKLPYDRNWIYRSCRGDVILDVIWQLANYCADVDESWITGGPMLDVRGTRLRILRPEELIYAKIFVMQRERCDWPDILNIINCVGSDIRWDRLIMLMQDDSRLLGSVLNTYAWLCPEQAAQIPAAVWDQLGIQPPGEDNPTPRERSRADLLDSRDWFGANRPEE